LVKLQILRGKQRMLSNIIMPAANAAVATLGGAGTPSSGQNFLSLVNEALQDVSSTQAAAASAQAGVAAGVPGATISKALVASDRAEVAWNATVAVRNEIVSAYQSIMNMQF
jgi:flagellar hook-basal body complex protein FliE